MNNKIKYPILIINGIAVLFAYYFKLNNPLVILWRWSIWGLIYYEHIGFAEAIEERSYVGLSKVILIINGSTQFIFNLIYSYLIVNSINNIYSIYFLCFLQLIKFCTSFIYKKGIEKIKEEHEELSIEDIVKQVSKKIMNYLLFNKQHKLEKNLKLLLISAASFIYLLGGMMISNLLILIVDKKGFEVAIFIIFSIILLLLNYNIYCLKDDDYIKWIIYTLGGVLSFITFNEVLGINTGGFLVRIFFSVYFLTPHLLYIRRIIIKYKLLEE